MGKFNTRTGGQDTGIYTPETPTEQLQKDMPQTEISQGSIFDYMDMDVQGAATDGGTESMDAYFNEAERIVEASEDPKAPVNIPVEDKKLPRGSGERLVKDIIGQMERSKESELQAGLDELDRPGVGLEKAIERLDPFVNEAGYLVTRKPPSFKFDEPRLSSSYNEDYGLYERVQKVQELFGTTVDTVTGQEKASPMLSTVRNAGSTFGKLVRNLDALDPDLGVDPNLTMTIGAVTEHFIAESSAGNDPFMDVSFVDAKTEEEMNILEAEGPVGGSVGRPVTPVKKAQQNTRLGQMIFQEYKRLRDANGMPDNLPAELDKETATLLGDMAKETYAAALGSDYMTRALGDDGQIYFQPSQQLVAKYDANKPLRDRTFGKPMVRPQRSSQSRLQGDMKLYTKRISGAKGESKNYMADEAMHNLNKVANVVIPTRAKILMSTILEALKVPANEILDIEDGSSLDMMTHINGVGKEKFNYFLSRANSEAKIKGLDKEVAFANAVKNFEVYRTNIAKSLYGIAMEANGINHLTYYRQAFNGRLAPQQTHFDPTTYKTVRFVTGSPNKVEVRKGTIQYNNIIQMYALTIGSKGTDALLPEERKKAIIMQESTLRLMGERLFNIMQEGMTNDQLNGVYNSINNNVALSNPSFTKYNLMALDPVNDADLIKAIKDRGEDGLLFIDGLIDFYHFSNAMKNNRPHYTQLNAYIDGKTNGLAANGMQMGDYEIAMRTGVIRSSSSAYAVDNDIDIRDNLQDVLLEMLNTNGFTGHFKDVAVPDQLMLVAEVAFTSKALHKKTTMTFGYGREVDRFIVEIEESLAELSEGEGDIKVGDKVVSKGEVRAALEYLIGYSNNSQGQFDYLNSLLGMYMEGLYRVMSRKGIESRHMMWGAAALHAMANTVFEITGPNWLPLRFAGTEPDADLTVALSKYSIRTEEGKLNVQPYMYGTRTTSAAPKNRVVQQGEEEVTIKDFGGDAWGGAVPGPVQAIDAATVAMTFSGRSWHRLSKASGGENKVYAHQIYDAFKMDVNGYHVMLEEVNQNWKQAALQWSYLKETRNSLDKAYAAIKEVTKGGKPDDLLKMADFPYLNYLLTQGVYDKSYNYGRDFETISPVLRRKLASLAPFEVEPKQPKKAIDEAKDRKDFGHQAMKELHKIITPGVDLITRKQYRDFMVKFMELTQYKKRLDDMIRITERDKKNLSKQIKDVYQYYTH